MTVQKTYIFAGSSSAIAEETAKILKQSGDKIIGISTKAQSWEYDEFHQISDYGFGNFPAIEDTIDGLVYFPGTINLKPFHRLTETEFRYDMDVNAFGAVSFLQNYLPNIKKSGNGSIVLISSVAVATGMPFHASISMAKGAIEGLTKSLAAELAPSIRVNCVAPSLVNTPLGSKFLSTPEKTEQMEKRNPLRKIGQPIDIANAIKYLLSEDSAWVSGQIFAIDGGMGALKNG